MGIGIEIKGDDCHQQHHGASQGIKEKLDRGIGLPRAAPDGDKQVHRDEHGFPENIEQHEIKGHEHAQHGGFHDQQTDHERLDPLLDIPPRTQHAERHE